MAPPQGKDQLRVGGLATGQDPGCSHGQFIHSFSRSTPPRSPTGLVTWVVAAAKCAGHEDATCLRWASLVRRVRTFAWDACALGLSRALLPVGVTDANLCASFAAGSAVRAGPWPATISRCGASLIGPDQARPAKQSKTKQNKTKLGRGRRAHRDRHYPGGKIGAAIAPKKERVRPGRPRLSARLASCRGSLRGVLTPIATPAISLCSGRARRGPARPRLSAARTKPRWTGSAPGSYWREP
jgi:hypothetical protein